MNRTKVLFLCTGNSARSQMAEALVRHYAGDRIEAHSAGLEPKGINPYTRQVMNEIGIDISQQRSKSVKEYMGRMHFETLITVCQHAEENCPTTFLGFGTKLHWNLPDPAAFVGSEAETLDEFRRVRDAIDRHVTSWLAQQGLLSEDNQPL